VMIRPPEAYLSSPSMAGQTVIVTGANTGIGLHTARYCALAGARVIFACRSKERASEAMDKMLRDAAGKISADQLVFLRLDLNDHGSVRAFAQEVSRQSITVDRLILNAGVMLAKRSYTVDGLESTLASNHFGHFLLAQLLVPGILAAESKGARPRFVVLVSSMAYRNDLLDLTEFNAATTPKELQTMMRKPYTLFRAYSQSKLANMLFVAELDRRLRALGSKVPVIGVHPGEVATTIFKDLGYIPALVQPVIELFLKSPRQGCMCTLRAAMWEDCATAEEGNSGKLFVRCQPAPLTKAMKDADLAHELWVTCQRLVGECGI